MHFTKAIKFRSIYSRNRDWMQNLFKTFFVCVCESECECGLKTKSQRDENMLFKVHYNL